MHSRIWNLTGPRVFTEIAIELPPLGADEVQVAFQYCGLCGSDVSTYEDRRDRAFPVSLGHEFVAIIGACGSDVVDFRVGDVVTSDLNFRCGTCRQCVEKRSHLCEVSQKGAFSNRGFGTQAHMHTNYLTKIPSGNVAPHYCLAEPLSCALHAFNHVSPTASDRILILGAGSLGTCMALILIDLELPADLWDVNKSRRDAIAKLAPSIEAVEPKDECYDVVFDLTGSIEGLKRASVAVRRGGCLVTMSHLDGYGPTDFLLPALTRRDVWFIVSYLNGEKKTLAEAVALIDRTWTCEFSNLLKLSPIEILPSVFSRRRHSSVNKDIFCLSDWQTGEN